MKLLITSQVAGVLEPNTVVVSAEDDLLAVTKVFSANSFDLIETHSPISVACNNLGEKDLWK